MDKTVIYVYVFCLLAKCTTQQYPPFFQNPMQPYDNYNDMAMENMYDYDDTSECSCSCETCEDLKPCCRNTCGNCFQPSPSIVLIPYPYPLIISTMQKESTTVQPQPTETPTKILVTKEPEIPTTVTIRSEIPTTVTIRPEIPTTVTTVLPIKELLRNNDEYINDIIAKAPHISRKNRFALTNLRRTKPDWIPKYGIVPISDNLAEKLMLQLRSMRVLHPQKETFKPTATLSSLEKI